MPFIISEKEIFKHKCNKTCIGLVCQKIPSKIKMKESFCMLYERFSSVKMSVPPDSYLGLVTSLLKCWKDFFVYRDNIIPRDI
jgi:hypothetical protein